MSSPWEARADVVVVGSGVAGLTTALAAVRLGLRAVVVTKGSAQDGSTALAQGGIAVVRPDECDPADSVRRHVDDTLAAGAGLCDHEAVGAVIGSGAAAVGRLRSAGAVFDAATDGVLARTREGGHTAYRVVHAGGDATGAEVERALLAAARDRELVILEDHAALDIARGSDGAVAGLSVLDTATSGEAAGLLRAPAVVLATGGLGQLYQATSNPAVATGDGLALALRAGAEVADLEFVQFHPTVLYTGPGAQGKRPLVTEAVRGEGAVLIDAAGEPVMAGVHPQGDLAPRDVVAAAITRRMSSGAAGVDDHVFLDATRLELFASRFPTVHRACVAAGIDPGAEPIPVAPAAHFACGGVIATIDGRTNLPGLYAVGEVARTGLHGANRLASNSLLEGLVVGERTARAVAYDRARGVVRLGEADPPAPALQRWRPPVDRALLQQAMSRNVAIGRTAEGLADVERLFSSRPGGDLTPPRTRAGIEDAALTLVAEALVLAARTREESRGCHVRHDRQRRDDARWRHSVAIRLGEDGLPMLAEPVELRGAA